LRKGREVATGRLLENCLNGKEFIIREFGYRIQSAPGTELVDMLGVKAIAERTHDAENGFGPVPLVSGKLPVA